MLDFEGVQIQLVDTPPLDREYLEPELIDLIRRSDLILLVVDLQTDPERQLEKTIATLEQNHILPAHRRDRYTGGEEVTFIPLLVVANKCDDESLDEICQVFHELLAEDWPALAVSARTGRDLEKLKRAVFDQLHLVRIYSRAPGKEPDFNAPFVMKQGATLEEFAGRIHKDFLEKLKFARVWGSTAFDGQMVQRDYPLQDGDIVELHT
jgi:ribosome-interacting GTPase 1